MRVVFRMSNWKGTEELGVDPGEFVLIRDGEDNLNLGDYMEVTPIAAPYVDTETLGEDKPLFVWPIRIEHCLQEEGEIETEFRSSSKVLAIQLGFKMQLFKTYKWRSFKRATRKLTDGTPFTIYGMKYDEIEECDAVDYEDN